MIFFVCFYIHKTTITTLFYIFPGLWNVLWKIWRTAPSTGFMFAQEVNITKALMWHHQNYVFWCNITTVQDHFDWWKVQSKCCNFPHCAVNKGHLLLFQCSPLWLVSTVTSSFDLTRFFKNMRLFASLIRSLCVRTLRVEVVGLCSVQNTQQFTDQRRRVRGQHGGVWLHLGRICDCWHWDVKGWTEEGK